MLFYQRISNIMSTQLTFVLEKKAKSAGGDKYVCSTLPEFNIYIPQTISRSGREPFATLTITIQPTQPKSDDEEK